MDTWLKDRFLFLTILYFVFHQYGQYDKQVTQTTPASQIRISCSIPWIFLLFINITQWAQEHCSLNRSTSYSVMCSASSTSCCQVFHIRKNKQKVFVKLVTIAAFPFGYMWCPGAIWRPLVDSLEAPRAMLDAPFAPVPVTAAHPSP